jgi:hypothetical protein
MVPMAHGFYCFREGRWVLSADVAIRRYATSRMAVLLEAVAYRCKDGREVMAPVGMRFDGGSKPAVTWPIFGNPWGAYLAAYTIHDRQCAMVEQRISEGAVDLKEARKQRKQADKDFKEGLEWIMRFLHEDDAGDRLINRLKFKAVRLHAWWTLRTR